MKINKSKANLQNGVDTSVCFDKGMPNCTCGSAKRRNEISTAVDHRWFDKPKNGFDLFNIFLTCGLHSDSCAYLSIHQTGMFSLAIDQNSLFFFHYQSLKIFYRSSLSC